MPYIAGKDTKEKLSGLADAALTVINNDVETDPVGSLNYFITTFLWKFTKQKKIRYYTFVLVAGTLILVLFEYVRRVVTPYENAKIAENGDVYS